MLCLSTERQSTEANEITGPLRTGNPMPAAAALTARRMDSSQPIGIPDGVQVELKFPPTTVVATMTSPMAAAGIRAPANPTDIAAAAGWRLKIAVAAAFAACGPMPVGTSQYA